MLDDRRSRVVVDVRVQVEHDLERLHMESMEKETSEHCGARSARARRNNSDSSRPSRSSRSGTRRLIGPCISSSLEMCRMNMIEHGVRTAAAAAVVRDGDVELALRLLAWLPSRLPARLLARANVDERVTPRTSPKRAAPHPASPGPWRCSWSWRCSCWTWCCR